MQIRITIEHFVTRARKLSAQGMLHINLRQLELAWLDLRIDLFHEVKVSALGLFIIGVASHGNIAAGRLLIERGGQLAPIEQPALEFRN